jgi:predicted dehydrogenase
MRAASRLRVGLVGAGMVSEHHLAAWTKMPDVRVVGIADPDLDRARARAQAFEIEAAYASADALIATTVPDALDIAAPVQHHAALCRLAAKSGIAILCQKPLAESVADAARLIDDIGDRVPFMVHENWRFRPNYRQVKHWLSEGAIGNVGLVRLCVDSSGLIADDRDQIPALVRQPFLANLPRFLVFEVLFHHLDALRWLFGEVSVVAARLSRMARLVRGEDSAAVLMEAPGQVPITLDACFAVPDAPSHVRDRFEIYGSRGVIQLADGAVTLVGQRTSQHEWDNGVLYAASFEGAIREFADGLIAQGPFETEARDNLKTLQLVEDVYAAADQAE